MNNRHSQLFKWAMMGLLLLPNFLLGQDANQSETQQLLEIYVRDFIESYAEIPETKDKAAVLKYLSPQSQSTIFYFSIADHVRLQTSDFEGFEKYLEKLMHSREMNVTYALQEIIRNDVNGDVAVVTAVINYELTQTDGFHTKGSETVTFAWKKIAGTWQIVYFTVMGIEDEKLRGTCLCEVFSSGDDQYLVRTTMPNGRSYDDSFNEFETKEVGRDITIHAKEHSWYTFSSTGDVWRLDSNQSAIDKIDENRDLGMAKDIKAAILLIIQKDLFADKCTRIKIRK